MSQLAGNCNSSCLRNLKLQVEVEAPHWQGQRAWNLNTMNMCLSLTSTAQVGHLVIASFRQSSLVSQSVRQESVPGRQESGHWAQGTWTSWTQSHSMTGSRIRMRNISFSRDFFILLPRFDKLLPTWTDFINNCIQCIQCMSALERTLAALPWYRGHWQCDRWRATMMEYRFEDSPFRQPVVSLGRPGLRLEIAPIQTGREQEF